MPSDSAASVIALVVVLLACAAQRAEGTTAWTRISGGGF